MASDRTRELARDVIDQVLMSYGAGFGTDKMLEIVLPKLDAFERETRLLDEAKWWEYRVSLLYQLDRKDSITAMEALRRDGMKRIAALAAQPSPQAKEEVK